MGGGTDVLFDGNEHIIGTWNGQTLYGKFIDQTLTTYVDNTQRRVFYLILNGVTAFVKGVGFAEYPNVNKITCGSVALQSNLAVDLTIALLGGGEIDVVCPISRGITSAKLQLWVEYLKS